MDKTIDKVDFLSDEIELVSGEDLILDIPEQEEEGIELVDGFDLDIEEEETEEKEEEDSVSIVDDISDLIDSFEDDNSMLANHLNEMAEVKNKANIGAVGALKTLTEEELKEIVRLQKKLEHRLSLGYADKVIKKKYGNSNKAMEHLLNTDKLFSFDSTIGSIFKIDDFMI